MVQRLLIAELAALYPLQYRRPVDTDGCGYGFWGNPFVGLFRMATMETPIIKSLESGIRETGTLTGQNLRRNAMTERELVLIIANMEKYGREMSADGDDAMLAINKLIGEARILKASFSERPNTVSLNDRELNTILHALRCYQDPSGESSACDHFDDAPCLSNKEIDTLCERFVLSPMPAADDPQEDIDDDYAPTNYFGQDGKVKETI